MFRQLKKKHGCNPHCCYDHWSGSPGVCRQRRHLAGYGNLRRKHAFHWREMQMGDYYVRQLRGSAPLINDPLLTQYINSLGMRLVSHANSVKTPFHFFLINNDEINAFAFFGGNVVLHSALFRYSDNESQLASVMAHEISHVTQRHWRERWKISSAARR